MKTLLTVTLAAIATVMLSFGLVRVSTGQVRPERLDALPSDVATPADNPSTPERVHLGRLLFWDPILSGNEDVACAT